MISGGPSWRGVVLIGCVFVSLLFLGVALDSPSAGQTGISGTIDGHADEDIEVTIHADGVSETVTVPSEYDTEGESLVTVIRRVFDAGGQDYTMGLEDPGEFEVRAEANDTRYTVMPRDPDPFQVGPGLLPTNVTRTVNVSERQTTRVDFQVTHRLAPAFGESRERRWGGNGGIVLLPEWLSLRMVVAFLLVSVLSLLAVLFVRAAPTTDGIDGMDVAGASDGATLGSIAGRAADRIERAGSLENEVYRAWYEMTRTLAVTDPVTSTPGEFERAAIDAGLPPDAVTDLTELFNEVRYGGADPNVHAEQAIETLRAIEAAGETKREDRP